MLHEYYQEAMFIFSNSGTQFEYDTF